MYPYRLLYLYGAKEDLSAAVNYYNAQSPGLGRVFRNEVKRQLQLVRQNPFTCSVRYQDVRFAVLKKFPYCIHYTVDGTADRIIIIAIFCDYLDPESHWDKG